MVLRRYNSQESLNRILRAFRGDAPSDDAPDMLSGGMVTWDEALSYIAELFQGSYPDVTGTFPAGMRLLTGSFSGAHEALHRYGIGEQRLGNAGSHLWIDENGNARLVGDAVTWSDFSVPLTRTQQGANNKPDFDTTNIGLLFPQNDTTEKVYFTVQFSHNKKLGSEIRPHIHYIQSVTGTPIFQYTYRWYNLDDNIPTAWVTGSTADGQRNIFTYVSGSQSQLGVFPTIEWNKPWDEKYSSNLDIILWRNDNVVTGDVLVKFIDIHYQIDGFGSNDIYT